MVDCVVLLVQVRAADVELPEGATFVVANSLTVSKKAETADRRWARQTLPNKYFFSACTRLGSWHPYQPLHVGP
jgi:hypothetical protein